MIGVSRMVTSGAFRIRDVRYAPREDQGRHAHGELQISVIVAGEMDEAVHGVTYRGVSGDVVVKPAGLSHANGFTATRIVCIDADPSGFDVPLPGYGWHRSANVTRSGVQLAVRFLRGQSVDEALDDLIAALPPAVITDRAVATRAARAIDDLYASPVSIDTLASELRVHRVYLARVFRAQWGCSPREYIQHVRVRAAAHRIASTTKPLAEIALDTGFSDQAHMSRMFMRNMGVTPAAFRRIARS
jgi:AraC family transcriptional regulator